MRQLGNWRFGVQAFLSLALLGVPFVRIAGESLLRFDLASSTFFLTGRPFAVEELYLLLLASIVFVLLFLLVTLAYGRAWCGWGCPQTILTDLSEWFARRIGGKVKAGTFILNRWQRLLLHLFLAALALLVAANLLFYFISPYAFFPALVAAAVPPAALWLLALTATALYLDLAFVRRLLCREFCPYGRFQAALVDAGTLTLRFHPDEASRCIRCGCCVKVCPTGIDIRVGYQVECINCGRCLDACRRVMVARRQPGIIRYTFGGQDQGVRALANGRILFVATALLVAVVIFTLAVVRREPVSLKLSRPATAPVRLLADGRTINIFLAVASNRQQQTAHASLVALNAQGEILEVFGPVHDLELPPGQNRRLDFTVAQPAGAGAGPLRLQLRDPHGRILAEADGQLLPGAREKR